MECLLQNVPVTFDIQKRKYHSSTCENEAQVTRTYQALLARGIKAQHNRQWTHQPANASKHTTLEHLPLYHHSSTKCLLLITSSTIPAAASRPLTASSMTHFTREPCSKSKTKTPSGQGESPEVVVELSAIERELHKNVVILNPSSLDGLQIIATACSVINSMRIL